VVALKPLHDAAKIKRVVVSTYQSVSGAGKEGMDELFNQTRASSSATRTCQEVHQADRLQRHPAHRRLHGRRLHQGRVEDDGETKKILDPKIKLTATCVRVPVFIGHSEAVNIEFEKPITADEAREILRDAPGIQVVDKREDGGYITPIECGRRGRGLHLAHPRGFDGRERPRLWCVSDNLRKGAALNAVQIAELLGRRHLKKG
jgi:aspartate-semialdehyde dehydrogenase